MPKFKLSPAKSDRLLALTRTLMARGELVPDEIVLPLIRERKHCLHCQSGFILDGFPRTLPQAKNLDAFLAQEEIPLDAVISYELPDDEILARLTGRRVCPGCKTVFHATDRPPRHPGACDHCGTGLVLRPDDTPEVVKVRLVAYRATHAPLTGHYRAKGLLRPISAQGRPEEIFARTLDALVLQHPTAGSGI